MIPERVRVNMRYRGPKESLKMNHVHAATVANLAKAEQALTDLSQLIGQHKSRIYNGEQPHDAFEKPLAVRAEKVTRRIQNLERGVGNV